MSMAIHRLTFFTQPHTSVLILAAMEEPSLEAQRTIIRDDFAGKSPGYMRKETSSLAEYVDEHARTITSAFGVA